MKNEIIQTLSKTPNLPVLFVGSGLTRRYLDLPDWPGLLKGFCNNLAKPYSYYYDKAERATHDNPDLLLPTIADYIENDFNELWYTSSIFESSRIQHSTDFERTASPFKLCIADYFREKSNNIVPKYASEISLLKSASNKHISCILTTNYDLFFENFLGQDKFQTYIGQSELLFSPLLELAEIYKIHGCCSDPQSIIINSYDYNNFMAKSSYLSAKILTIFLENPIIFIGYSISDMNIKMILESISNCLNDIQLDKLKSRMIFIEWNTDPTIPDYSTEKTITFTNRKSITMKSFFINDFSILYEALLDNNVKYEVKSLRRIKSQLYELVKTNKPTEKLYLATNIDNAQEDVDFVVGIGVYGKFGKVGYRGLRLNELYRYILGISDLQYDEQMILEEAIPSLYNGRTTLPVCKLISNCTDLKYINEKVSLSFKTSFSDILSWGEQQWIAKNGYFSMPLSIYAYYEQSSLSNVLAKIPLMEPNKIDIQELESFLMRVIEENPTLLSRESNVRHPSDSQCRKCISILDWLKYHDLATTNLDILAVNNTDES